MKNFLAVDTCGKHLAVLARKGEKTSRFFLPDCAMRHSVLLMDGIDEALRGADLSPGECDFFAVATGPGSFTGIRIGISAVKGFCLAAGKPALPVTAFEEMASASGTVEIAVVEFPVGGMTLPVTIVLPPAASAAAGGFLGGLADALRGVQAGLAGVRAWA